MRFAISQQGEGLPVYFQKVSTWVNDSQDALLFARERDAQTFIDNYLPHLSTVCTITPIKLEKTE